MYILYRNDQVIGYCETQAEAVAALEEESRKEDGVELRFELEDEKENRHEDG
jgi:hypothetical protein